MKLFQNIMDLVLLCFFQRVIVILEISAGITQRRIEPELVEIIAQVIMGAYLFPLCRLVFRRIEKGGNGIPVQRELIDLLEEPFKDGEHIPFDFNVPSHVRFPKSKGRRSQEFLLRNILMENNAAYRLTFPDPVFLAANHYVETVFIKSLQIINKEII